MSGIKWYPFVFSAYKIWLMWRFMFFVSCPWIKYISVWWCGSPDSPCLCLFSPGFSFVYLQLFSSLFTWRVEKDAYYRPGWRLFTLKLFFCSLGFSRSVADGLEPSSGRDRNGNYRPETFVSSLIATLPVIQIVTLDAPEEAGWGFEYERRLCCCCALNMFQKVSECSAGWRRLIV